MKRIKLLPGLLMFLLAVVCLISVPALSGENPWDADGGGGDNGSGSPLDSTLYDAGTLSAQSEVQSTGTTNDQYPGWLSRTVLRMYAFMAEHFTVKTSSKTKLSKPAY